MDFKKYLDDSYKFVEGDDLYKINGGETYEQHMYGSLAYVKNGDTSGGSGNGSTSSSSGDNKGSSTQANTNLGDVNLSDKGFNISTAGYGQGYNNTPTSGSWGSINNEDNRKKNMQQYINGDLDKLMYGKTKNKNGVFEDNAFNKWVAKYKQ